VIKTLMAAVAVVTMGAAYWTGSAPWCRVDDWGNGQCFYYSLSACRSGLGQNETCVLQGGR
jgi:hypothetical protein